MPRRRDLDAHSTATPAPGKFEGNGHSIVEESTLPPEVPASVPLKSQGRASGTGGTGGTGQQTKQPTPPVGKGIRLPLTPLDSRRVRPLEWLSKNTWVKVSADGQFETVVSETPEGEALAELKLGRFKTVHDAKRALDFLLTLLTDDAGHEQPWRGGQVQLLRRFIQLLGTMNESELDQTLSDLEEPARDADFSSVVLPDDLADDEG